MSHNSQQFRLPDTLEHWPWKRLLNPHFQEAKDESAAWLRSFGAFEPRQQQKFDLCDFNLLAGLSYSLLSKEHLRVGCDFLNFVFVYDEFADVLDKDGAQRQADIVMDALRNPTKARPQGESLIGEIARQFWERAISSVEPDSACLRNFISEFDAYTSAVISEMEDHRTKRVRNVEDYLALRRDTCGVASTLSIIEFGLDLPADVLRHPIVASLTEGAVKLIGIINDLNSYHMEQSRGLATHNIVTVAMHEFKVDHIGAMDWLEAHIKEDVRRFLANYARLPSWGEDIDRRLKTYIDGLGYWVRGNDSWSFEGQRYFGRQGLEIQKSRLVTLQPSKELEGFVKGHRRISAPSEC